MLVTLGVIEYTLYIGADGIWSMHTFDTSRPEGERWLDTNYAVNLVNPFKSRVNYAAWE